jgi:hypothetical protein
MVRFLKTKTYLVNKKEAEDIERLGLDKYDPTEVAVAGYYAIDPCNVTAVTEFVDNEGEVDPEKSNIIFLNDTNIVAGVAPEVFIEEVLKEKIVIV